MIVLRQKEYGLRSWAGGILDKYIAQEFLKLDGILSALEASEKIDNPKLRKALVEEAKKMGIAVVNKGKDGSNNTSETSMILTDVNKLIGNIIEDMKIHDNIEQKELKEEILKVTEGNERGLIFAPKSSGGEGLSHEIGHARYHLDSDPKIKKKVLDSINARINFDEKGRWFLYENGCKRAWLNLKMGVAIESDEKAATEYGYSLLKKLGATEKELEIARENFKNQLKTYHIDTKVRTLIPIKNWLLKKHV